MMDPEISKQRQIDFLAKEELVFRHQDLAANIMLTLQKGASAIGENMKQWQEAAKLYQKGGLVEKAASIYIQMKMFSAAAPLMD